MNMDFKSSLSDGKQLEYEVCKLIQRKYPQAHVIEGYFKGGDIVVPEKNMLVEVKKDYKSHFTNNFLIEISCDGSPSALTTTQSAYWVIVDRDYYVWVSPDTLWMIIKSLKLRPTTLTGNSDTYTKVAYLVPKAKIIFSPFVTAVPRLKSPRSWI